MIVNTTKEEAILNAINILTDTGIETEIRIRIYYNKTTCEWVVEVGEDWDDDCYE